MKINKWLLTLLGCCCCTLLGMAQGSMNQWTIYPSIYYPQQIIETPSVVYYTSNGFLYSYDKEDESMNAFTRQNGLSDNGIELIRYDRESAILFISYENGNIDILKKGKVYNIPDLKNKILSISKRVNDVSFHGSIAYLSTDFGVLFIDMERYEVIQTFNFEEPINSTVQMRDSLYLAFASGGLRSIPVESNRWFDAAAWSQVSDSTFNQVVVVDTLIYGATSNELQLYHEAQWSTLIDAYVGVKRINEATEGIVAIGKDCTYYFKKENPKVIEQVICPEDKSYSDVSYNNYNYHFWVNTNQGVTVLQRRIGEPTESVVKDYMRYNTLNVDRPYHLALSNGYLYVNNEGRGLFQEAQDQAGFLSVLDPDNRWHNIIPNPTEVPVKRRPYYTFGLNNLYSLLPDPREPETFYVGSWFEGLYKFKGLKFHAFYNDKAEGMPSSFSPDAWTCKINSPQFDAKGNLWMLYYTEAGGSPILVKTPQEKWYELDYAELNNQIYLEQLFISPTTGHKWIINSLYENGFVFLIDDGGTVDTSADDTTKRFDTFIDQDGNMVSTHLYYTLVEDNRGTLWIGCDKGVILLRYPENAFKSDYRCSRVKIPRNDGTNYADILLEDAHVKTIAVDGANRKWLGTLGGGLYLVSEDGTEIIEHFTAANSYLPSDIILSLAINHQTGEIYVGTDKGLVSYRTSVVEAQTDFSNVYAFPNPVRPDYHGAITITGLQENTLVKITTLSGGQVYQAISEGGQLVWNGLNQAGNRVASGIYLVVAEAFNNNETVVTKIMVIN